MRRPRDPEDEQDVPPPKPVTRTTSGQAAAPNDQNMEEALVSTVGAQQQQIEKAAEGNVRVGEASASETRKGPQQERDKKIHQNRKKEKAPAEETTPAEETQGSFGLSGRAAELTRISGDGGHQICRGEIARQI
eukprot:5521072-Prymnesium_polylepis.1